MSSDAWPRAWGEPTLSGRIRERHEDFQVREVLGFEPDGSGEHLWLEVEKVGLTTHAAQQQLARAFRVPLREVHYAGLKDRRALTTQWFSLRVGVKYPRDDLPELPEGLRVLRAVKNSRKLRRGSHRGNRFTLTIRGLSGATDALAARLETIAREGVPNYFGEQRFGHDGGNLRALQEWFEGGREPPRHIRSLLLSAGRAFLFNAVLAERIRRGDWNRLLEGDRLNLDGTSRLVPAAANLEAETLQRLSCLDLHPTGPLWGSGEPEVSSAALILERSVLEPHESLCQGLARAGLEHARRPLRVAVRNLQYELQDERLMLEFELTSGAYATAVLREIVHYETAVNDVEEDGD